MYSCFALGDPRVDACQVLHVASLAGFCAGIDGLDVVAIVAQGLDLLEADGADLRQNRYIDRHSTLLRLLPLGHPHILWVSTAIDPRLIPTLNLALNLALSLNPLPNLTLHPDLSLLPFAASPLSSTMVTPPCAQTARVAQSVAGGAMLKRLLPIAGAILGVLLFIVRPFRRRRRNRES